MIVLLAINVGVIAVALWQGWSLVGLLWPYWLQSVVVGWYSRKRILSLVRFSTEGTSGFEAEPGVDVRRSTANFFVAHYGIFHFVYFFFLIMVTTGAAMNIPAHDITRLDVVYMIACGLSFILVHRRSYARIIDSDAYGVPSIGGVMALPYLRVVPMHFAILIGLGTAQGGPGGVLLFGALKTAADLLMHWTEYRITSRKLQSPT